MEKEKLRQNAAGEEIPDPQPISIPSGFKRPETLQEQIRRLIRSEELENIANQHDVDTFEEAEDFDVDDETFDPSSPYEEVFDPVLGRSITLQEFQQNHEIYRQRYLEAEQKAYQHMERSEALRARPKREAAEGAAPAQKPQDTPKDPPTDR